MRPSTNFKDLNIDFEERDTYVGDKIPIRQVFNRKIKILKYKIGPSKFKGDCLTLQILLDDKKYMIETGSANLQFVIKQIPLSRFPIDTIIIEKDKTYKFT